MYMHGEIKDHPIYVAYDTYMAYTLYICMHTIYTHIYIYGIYMGLHVCM